MAKYFGSVQGARGEASRLGHEATGLTTKAASYEGAVQVDLSVDSAGIVIATVQLIPWMGSGVYHTLYNGPVSEYRP